MLFKEFHHFWLPKRGNTLEEYEDAAAGNAAAGRFAVADGASESSYAGPWARLLVEGFLQTPTLELPAWIAPLRERWLKDLGDGPFSWFTETKIQHGAFATFLGVSLEVKKEDAKDNVVWRAIAVGDSCVFQVRAGRCVRKFPVLRCEDFDNSPGLVCSRPQKEIESHLKRTFTDKLCQPGDQLWLMTDALAMWFLQQESERKKPWETLAPLLQWPDGAASFASWNEPPSDVQKLRHQAFEAWIDERRTTEELRNDDVTLLVICF